MPTINKILLATDFSDDSAHALDYAEELARKFGSEIVLLHADQALVPVVVGAEPGSMFEPVPAEALGRVAEERRLLAQRELDRLSTRLRDGGLKARAILRVGSPFVEIVTAAQTENADLIVMGTHGRTGLAHLIIGSVAEHVARKAPAAVL